MINFEDAMRPPDFETNAANFIQIVHSKIRPRYPTLSFVTSNATEETLKNLDEGIKNGSNMDPDRFKNAYRAEVDSTLQANILVIIQTENPDSFSLINNASEDVMNAALKRNAVQSYLQDIFLEVPNIKSVLIRSLFI